MKKLAAVVALLCVFGLGMSFALLGALSVNLREHLSIGDAQYGTLIMVFMLSCLVMSLVVGLLVDKWGHKPLAILGFIVLALCIFAVGISSSYSLVVVALLLLGIGAMCLNTAGNTLIPVVLFGGKNPAAASNFGNVFFGLGAFLTPLLSAWLFKRSPEAYAGNITVLAVIALLPVIIAILAEYPIVRTGFTASQGVSLLGQPVVIIAGLTLFLYIALEASFTNWITPYGKEVSLKAMGEAGQQALAATTPEAIEALSAGAKQAANEAGATGKLMMSAFFIAMMVGRLTASQVKAITRIGDKVIAGVGLVVAIVILIMMKSSSEPLAWVLVILAGLACAPGFPTTAGVTFSKFQPRVYGSVFGIIFAIGLAGAVIVPKVIGNWAQDRTVQASLGILIPVGVLLIVFALILGTVKARGDVAAAPAEDTPQPAE